MLNLKKIQYTKLSSKAKESYNFHKLASILADYGFSSNWLNVDFESADFIAVHFNGIDVLKIQLKGRLTINRNYEKKDIYIAFPYQDNFYLIPHDKLIKIISSATTWLTSDSWKMKGQYSSQSLNKDLKERVLQFQL